MTDAVNNRRKNNMRTVRTKVFKFNELTDKAKQTAIENLYTINVDFDWWESTYEDAEQIGLKITSFDLDRNRHAKGMFLDNGINCAKLILESHGEMCETYKTAKSFLAEIEQIETNFESLDTSDFDNIQEKEDAIQDAESDFLNSILEDYSIIMQNECEYLQSDEAIAETIIANDYEFTQDGKIFNS